MSLKRLNVEKILAINVSEILLFPKWAHLPQGKKDVLIMGKVLIISEKFFFIKRKKL